MAEEEEVLQQCAITTALEEHVLQTLLPATSWNIVDADVPPSVSALVDPLTLQIIDSCDNENALVEQWRACERGIIVLCVEPSVEVARAWLLATAGDQGTPRAAVSFYVGHLHPTAPGAALALLQGVNLEACNGAVADRLRAYFHRMRTTRPFVTCIVHTDADRCVAADEDDVPPLPTSDAFERFWCDVAAQASVIVLAPSTKLSQCDRARLGTIITSQCGRQALMPIVTAADAKDILQSPSHHHVVYLQVLPEHVAQCTLPPVDELWYWQESLLLQQQLRAPTNNHHVRVGDYLFQQRQADARTLLTLRVAFDEQSTGALVACHVLGKETC